MTETLWFLTESTIGSAMKRGLDGWDYCHMGGHWSAPPRVLILLWSIILSFALSFILRRCARRLNIILWS